MSWWSKAVSAVSSFVAAGVESPASGPPDLDLNQTPRDLIELAWTRAEEENVRLREEAPHDHEALARSKLPHYLDAVIHALVREARQLGEATPVFRGRDDEFERGPDGDGECIVYLHESRMVETLASMGAADSPPGMMALVLAALHEMIAVRPDTLLPTEMMHKAIRQLHAACVQLRAADASAAAVVAGSADGTAPRDDAAAASHAKPRRSSTAMPVTSSIAQRMMVRLAHTVWLAIAERPNLLSCYYNERMLASRGPSAAGSGSRRSSATAGAGGSASSSSSSSSSSSLSIVQQELGILDAIAPWVHAQGSASAAPNHADLARESLVAAFSLRDPRIMGFVLFPGQAALLRQLASRAADAFGACVSAVVKSRQQAQHVQGAGETSAPASGAAASSGSGAGAPAGGSGASSAADTDPLKLLAALVDRLCFINQLLLAGGRSLVTHKLGASMRERVQALQAPPASSTAAAAAGGAAADSGFTSGATRRSVAPSIGGFADVIAAAAAAAAASDDKTGSRRSSTGSHDEAAAAAAAAAVATSFDWPTAGVPAPGGGFVRLPEDTLSVCLLHYTATALLQEAALPVLTSSSEAHAAAGMAVLGAVIRQLHARAPPTVRGANASVSSFGLGSSASAGAQPAASAAAGAGAGAGTSVSGTSAGSDAQPALLPSSAPLLYLLLCVVAGAAPTALRPVSSEPLPVLPAYAPVHGLPCFAAAARAAIRSRILRALAGTAASGGRNTGGGAAGAVGGGAGSASLASGAAGGGTGSGGGGSGGSASPSDAIASAALRLLKSSLSMPGASRIVLRSVLGPQWGQAMAMPSAERTALVLSVAGCDATGRVLLPFAPTSPRSGATTAAAAAAAAAAAIAAPPTIVPAWSVPESAAQVLWLRLHAAALDGISRGNDYRGKYGKPTGVGGPAYPYTSSTAAAAAVASGIAVGSDAPGASAPTAPVSFGDWMTAARQAAAVVADKIGMQSPAASTVGSSKAASASSTAATAPAGSDAGADAGAAADSASSTDAAVATPQRRPSSAAAASGGSHGASPAGSSSLKASDAEILSFCHGWAGLDAPVSTGATPTYFAEACRAVLMHQLHGSQAQAAGASGWAAGEDDYDCDGSSSGPSSGAGASDADALAATSASASAGAGGAASVGSGAAADAPPLLAACLVQRLRKVSDARAFDRDAFLTLTQLLATLAAAPSAPLHGLVFGFGSAASSTGGASGTVAGAAGGGSGGGGSGAGRRARGSTMPAAGAPAAGASTDAAAGSATAVTTVFDEACEAWTTFHKLMSAFSSSASVAVEAIGYVRACLGMEGGETSFFASLQPQHGPGATAGSVASPLAGRSYFGLRRGAGGSAASAAVPFDPVAALARLTPEAALFATEKRQLLEGYLLLQEALRELIAIADSKARLGALLQ